MKNLLLCFFAVFLTFAKADAQVIVNDFDTIKLYTLVNDKGMTVKITNYGAIITSMIVPDRDGKMGDVVLGYDRVEDYINAVDKPYFGAVVGRYGNRIAKGQFTLDGETYKLAVNNNENHLHGGVIGFDKVVWDANPIDSDQFKGLELSYLAKDMEEGYPGNLQLKVTYKLDQKSNTLTVDYAATTDKATPVNVTQHSYFNLKGEGEDTILDHELMINAKKYTPVDSGLIPTGETPSVQGTPFDFSVSKPIGRDVAMKKQQLEFGLGYDHNFVLDKPYGEMGLAARVFEPTTGRVLEITTTEPGVQFYCGNFLDGRLKGKSGKSYVHRGGFCLETQHYPDSPNQPNFPSTIVTPDKAYQSTTVFAFSTQK
ncbi:aldose epimerase family protein [Rubripirellula reticaptiva]|uniref:Aldose 1-epimerase n=1 Tax=Rubripirellula reticaptiva TaxID=2528013 RepID=A0A5C6F1U9_9BACT|nr:aldose epimerase family protein [Rubripirellula reticaptiva]TWU55065.1 Aldose 1-epimerase precursor [Rubripirellula reticaptiva]